MGGSGKPAYAVIVLASGMSTFFSPLPSDLQSAIKAVNKLTSAGGKSANINTTSDKLFLLSEVEVFGSADRSFTGEGSQYEWYKAGNTTIKKVNGSAYHWWERSPSKDYPAYFCVVSSSGSTSIEGASENRGVSFAFCV